VELRRSSFSVVARRERREGTSEELSGIGLTIGVVRMPRSKSYQEDLVESLKDPREAAAYLTAALEDDDSAVFLVALRDVVEAHGGGMTKLAERAKLSRENLYRMLSATGNPELHSLGAVLDALGFRLAIEVKKAS